MATSKKSIISKYMASLGSKGGKTKGPTKARDSETMRKASRKRWDKAKADKPATPDPSS